MARAEMLALPLRPAPLSDPTVMFHKHSQKSGQLVEHGVEFLSVHSYLWEPLSGLQLTAGSLGTAQLKGLSVEVGPLELGSVVALGPVTSTPISVPSLWKEKELEVCVHFFPFFFFAKGLLPVSQAVALTPRAQFIVYSALMD